MPEWQMKKILKDSIAYKRSSRKKKKKQIVTLLDFLLL